MVTIKSYDLVTSFSHGDHLFELVTNVTYVEACIIFMVFIVKQGTGQTAQSTKNRKYEDAFSTQTHFTVKRRGAVEED